MRTVIYKGNAHRSTKTEVIPEEDVTACGALPLHMQAVQCSSVQETVMYKQSACDAAFSMQSEVLACNCQQLLFTCRPAAWHSIGSHAVMQSA